MSWSREFLPPPSPPLASPFFEEAFYFELFVPSCSRIHLHKIQAAVSVLRERGGINFAPSGGNFACLLRWKHTSDGEIFKLLLARPKNRRWVVAGVGWRRGADPLPPRSTSRIHPFYPPISGINSCSIINESNRPTGNARVWHVFRCSPDFEKIMGETLVNSKFNSFFFFLRIVHTFVPPIFFICFNGDLKFGYQEICTYYWINLTLERYEEFEAYSCTVF